MASRVHRAGDERIGRLCLFDTATTRQIIGSKSGDRFVERLLPTRDVRVDHIQRSKARECGQAVSHPLSYRSQILANEAKSRRRASCHRN